jgi:hypothetical protein
MAKIPKSWIGSTKCKFSEKCMNTSQRLHAHCQCVHNKYTKFEECQPKGVRAVDYTK